MECVEHICQRPHLVCEANASIRNVGFLMYHIILRLVVGALHAI